MGRNISPLVQEELEKLEKDADSRRLAMKTLKSYATNIDSKLIPRFLAQVSEPNNQGSPSGECTISLFEVLARVHGRNIVPQIGSIMATIIRTLSTSGGSFPLHQACSKVVPAIARYGIDPSTRDDEKKRIIYSLSSPLTNGLMSSQESLASGCALCLRALVESNNWKFASDDAINDVCLKLACALEEKTVQTSSHMGLVMALAKHNPSIMEAYVGSLLRSGLHFLNIGIIDNISNMQFLAIQMISYLIKFIDSRSICSDLADVTDAMEKCQTDQMPYVKAAAFEVLQSAKALALQKGTKYDSFYKPANDFYLQKRHEKSPQVVDFATPESQTIASSIKNENFGESPNSVNLTPNGDNLSKRTQRKLWSNEFDNVSIPLKDSFSNACSKGNIAENEAERVEGDEEESRTKIELTESLNGFMLGNAGSTTSREMTPSPQSSRHQFIFDYIKLYTSPRKLIRSLQNQNDGKKEASVMLETSPAICKLHCESDSLNSDEACQSIESVSSTTDPAEDKDSEAKSMASYIEVRRTHINDIKNSWHKKIYYCFYFCPFSCMPCYNDAISER